MGTRGSWDKAGVKDRGDCRAVWDRQDQGRRTGLTKITQGRVQRRGAVRIQDSSMSYAPGSGMGWEGEHSAGGGTGK